MPEPKTEDIKEKTDEGTVVIGLTMTAKEKKWFMTTLLFVFVPGFLTACDIAYLVTMVAFGFAWLYLYTSNDKAIEKYLMVVLKAALIGIGASVIWGIIAYFAFN